MKEKLEDLIGKNVYVETLGNLAIGELIEVTDKALVLGGKRKKVVNFEYVISVEEQPVKEKKNKK